MPAESIGCPIFQALIYNMGFLVRWGARGLGVALYILWDAKLVWGAQNKIRLFLFFSESVYISYNV